MFDTTLVKNCLNRLLVKLVQEDAERHDELAVKLEELGREYDHRRELLAETLEYLAGRLRAGDRFARSALTGSNLKPLPRHLRTEWQAIWGEQYLHGEFAAYVDRDREAQDANRLKNQFGPKNAELCATVRQASVIMDAYLGKTVSYSTWERLRLPADLLPRAVALAKEAEK